MTDTWSHTLDFTKNDGGFTVNPTFLEGFWTAGVGWQAGDQTNCGSDCRRGADLLRSFSSTTITSVTVLYDLSKGTYDSPPERALWVFANNHEPPDALLINLDNTQVADGTNLIQSWMGVQSVTQLRLGMNTCYDDTPPFTYSGSETIKSLIITGTGVNPFLDHYCAACAINYIGIDVEEVLDGIGL